MHPPLFKVCAADAGVRAMLGDGPTLRLYAFGEALQKDKLPYAVWTVGGGEPENYLGEVPDTDNWTTHLDVYAETAANARAVVAALCAAIEPHSHVVSWDGERRENTTRAYWISFTVDWVTPRA